MRKLLALLLLLSPLSWASTGVTGNVKKLGTSSLAGVSVRFYLRGCAGNQPRVNGVGVLVPASGAVWFEEFVSDAAGNISGNIYSTRDVTGNSDGEIECGGNKNAVWYGMVVIQNGKAGPEVAIHAKNASTLDISNITPISTTPTTPAPTGDNTYARLDGGNGPLLTVAAKTVNGIKAAKGSGAKGDAVTDDATILRSLLNSSGSQSSIIDTPTPGLILRPEPGTYMLSAPLFLRKGDILDCGGGTTVIFKTLPTFPTNAAMVYMGFKSDGTQDAGGLAPVVQGCFFESGVAGVVGVSSVYGSGICSNPGQSNGTCISGWKVKDSWFITPIAIRGGGTDGEVSGNMCDGCSIGLELIGDGVAYGPSHTIRVVNNEWWLPQYACYHFDGVNNVELSAEFCDYPKQFGLYFSNAISGGTSSNVTLDTVHFQTSSSSTYYNATQTDIDVEWPVDGLKIVNTTHSRSRKAALLVANANAKNIVVDNMTVRDSNDSAIIISGQGNATKVHNSHFLNVGNYAIDTTLAVEANENDCKNPFTVTGVPANDYQKGCIRLNVASNSIVRNNTTDSTTVAAVVANSGGTGISSSGNRSGWATADTYWYNVTTAQSLDERAVNGLGQQYLTANISGSLTVGGTVTANGLPSGCAQLPCIVATFARSAQTANFAKTTMYTTPSAGVYRVTVTGYTSVAGSAGTSSLQVFGNHGGGETTQTSGTFSLTATTGEVTFIPVFRMTSGQPISIYANMAGATGSPQYGFDAVIEKISN